MLGHHHRLTDGKAKLTGGLLLQSRRGKWGSRRALDGLSDDTLNRIVSCLALFKESLHLFFRLEASTQLSLHLRCRTIGVSDGEDTIHHVINLALEILDLTLPLDNQPDCHTLNTSG